MIDDQKFFAWLDGELPPAEALEVEALIASDPELQRKAEAHRAMGAKLKGAFEPLVEASVNLPRTSVVSINRARQHRTGPQWWQQAAALAATLVLGMLLGGQFLTGPTGPALQENGRLVASRHLASALDKDLASEPKADGVRIGLTFHDKQGRICRTFSDAASSGLACNNSGSWELETLVGPAEGQQGDYRMAAGTDPRIAVAVDNLIEGEPLDSSMERSLRDRGWPSG